MTRLGEASIEYPSTTGGVVMKRTSLVSVSPRLRKLLLERASYDHRDTIYPGIRRRVREYLPHFRHPPIGKSEIQEE